MQAIGDHEAIHAMARQPVPVFHSDTQNVLIRALRHDVAYLAIAFLYCLSSI